MDKEEYRQKLDELTGYVGDKDYENALQIVNSIDWRRVKNINTLSMVAEVYEINKDYKKAKEILILARGRASIGKNILYRLVEVCLKLGDTDDAEKYFKDFSKVARNDNSRCVLQYKLYKAKNAPIEAQIDVLEEYREREYTEKWAYELALLYAKSGNSKKCVEACDDLILWFSEGEYVYKAMELKRQYEELSPSQQQAYASMKGLYDPRVGAFAAAAAQTVKGTESVTDREEDGEDDDLRKSAAGALTLTESPASVAHKALEGEDTRMMDTQDFNLEEFLKETAGALSDEIFGQEPADEKTDAAGAENAETSVAENGTESAEANPSDGESEQDASAQPAENARGDAAVDESEAVKDGEDTEEPDTSVKAGEGPQTEASAEDASEAGGQEVSDQENGVETENVLAQAVLEEIESTEEKADIGGATAELSRSLEALLGSQIRESQENAEEKEKRDAEKLKSAVAALESLTAGTSTENAGEDASSSEEASGESEEDLVVRELEQEDLSTDVPANESENAVVADPAPEKEEPAAKNGVNYNEELEVPDPEPTQQEKKSRTIPLNTIGQNTVPISIDKILSEETPEERRIRILNKAKPTRMNEEQRKIFTYFARIPGMDGQILDAINSVYEHAGERTSLHGNIAVMGAEGTGKSRLARGLVMTMCKDLGLEAAKVARITGEELNQKDPAKVVSMMAGGFLMVEKVSGMNEETLEKLNQAMEFRTDCMIMIIEDDKAQMRGFLKKHPQFGAKFDRVISVPVFTNDELITFARTYAVENGCKIDDLAILALYTMIGNIQTEEEPVTISTVKRMVDGAIHRATRGRRRKKNTSKDKWTILHEKDFG
uniref:hypothetical protein n=1 Tax=Eubacterium cellulosolvens TaxID=29322 RepID=UPI000481824C|nr:hypothetical protein [[Eubacterium] cellulosolvens]